MARKRNAARAKRARIQKPRPVRPKLDPRLSFLLALPPGRLKALREQEDQKLKELSEEIQAVRAAVEREPRDELRREHLAKLQALENRLFAPITTGVYFPPASRKAKPWPSDLKTPYLSVFLLSDASAKDLARLGVKVRSQAGDVFSAFVPIAMIPKLEASPAIRFIELARPLFPALDQALPYTQIDTLHAAQQPVTGTGVIVGVVDFVLDIYHPDFRTQAGASRVLFLWDETLTPQGTEVGPPTDPVLPGFMVGGTTYGVEYDQATINTELTSYNPPAVPAYRTVRHGEDPQNPGTHMVGDHGTHVAGIAAGNGLGTQAGTYTGAAPGADIIFVATPRVLSTDILADMTFVADAFAYIFARASLLGKPCVANMSNGDNQGPHDGTTLGEQFLDGLLVEPGRAITLPAGNYNNLSRHAAWRVQAGAAVTLVLNYQAGASESDAFEIWYDGHDSFDVTVTVPTSPATTVGAVSPGATQGATLANGVEVQVTSVLDDPRNHDNVISVIITVPSGQAIPAGNWAIALTGTTVINGNFHAWVDRNNGATWQPPHRQEGQVTIGVPGTARRAITVGNHDKTGPPPAIRSSSGRGPTRDGRIKPEIASVGTDVWAPKSWDMNAGPRPAPYYIQKSGTSMSAPLVAGACALLFECRGATSTWANLKQILEDTAGTNGLPIPSNAFGFGFMQMANACAQPPMNVDVWLRDHATDTGLEPFTGGIAWLSPDIEVLDTTGNPVPNPTYDPTRRFSNIIRVTVRNRGTQTARNTEVYLYWADPATNIPFPGAWNATGLYTDPPPAYTGGTYIEQGNKIVIPQLAPGGSAQVQFAWAPPPPGGNLRGDNHFCLLVRLENEGDSSGIGAGGWAVITTKNNIALRNVLVQQSPPEMSFYVVGSSDQDSLIVYPELARGRVELNLPIQALPWRDIRLIEKLDRRRLPYGCEGADDPLARARLTLKGVEVRMRTDVVGADALELENGVARILAAQNTRLFVPHVRLAEGARMPASIRVHRPRTSERQRFVHVAQLSGGQLVGGVTLQLRATRR